MATLDIAVVGEDEYEFLTLQYAFDGESSSGHVRGKLFSSGNIVRDYLKAIQDPVESVMVISDKLRKFVRDSDRFCWGHMMALAKLSNTLRKQQVRQHEANRNERENKSGAIRSREGRT